MSFRWFGPMDPIPLKYIRQIPGVRSIVSALYEVPVGEAWPAGAVAGLKQQVEDAGMRLDVIESIPVHEDIKLGRPSREGWAAKYADSIAALGKAGVPVLCYNFMPVFDWVRTNLSKQMADGSRALDYADDALARIDLSRGTRDLPGWATTYDGAQLNELLRAYQGVSEPQLWDNLAWFIDYIVPAAESANVKLAVHPDDPPWPIFGLPRILTSGDALLKLVGLNDSVANGVTLCTGSLAPAGAGELPRVVRDLGARGRIHFAHCRNIKVTGAHEFHEVAHPSEFGDVDMLEVLRALHETGFDGCIRPDHGRMIWDEDGRPGYGLYDRALGAAYLQGLWEAINRSLVNV
jgi:mannonate dehydratase